MSAEQMHNTSVNVASGSAMSKHEQASSVSIQPRYPRSMLGRVGWLTLCLLIGILMITLMGLGYYIWTIVFEVRSSLDTVSVTEILLSSDAQMRAALAGQVFAVPVLWLIWKRMRRHAFIHLYAQHVSMKQIGAAVVGILIAGVGIQLLMSFVLGLVLSQFPHLAQDYARHMEDLGTGTDIITVLSTALLAPILEEVTCRGLMFEYALRALAPFVPKDMRMRTSRNEGDTSQTEGLPHPPEGAQIGEIHAVHQEPEFTLSAPMHIPAMSEPPSTSESRVNSIEPSVATPETGLPRTEPQPPLSATELEEVATEPLEAILAKPSPDLVLPRHTKYALLGAMCIQAVLFGLLHGNIVQSSYAIVLGLVLGWVYLKSGKLWLSVCLHFAVNASSFFLEGLANLLAPAGDIGVFVVSVIITALGFRMFVRAFKRINSKAAMPLVLEN
ncbi:CPBP family intramembrane metalloprotease [Collinsella sp. zg1085]|uniref:CPBP family intramembrane glutamic endopeptidase n=1 Tax=Collinsella sp. zg1085 TaxID=2844380 RepID=UPI001C0B5350|nr:CPBP family intramembrane glutamic endopeptidase [Collinsella sp. zg1085]QWT18156.1 CPBP family intramembrane metalloprotease [Collinsella sp. zg1085]